MIFISNYTNSLYNDYEKVVTKIKEVEKRNKLLKLQNDILESENQRLDKIKIQKEKQIVEITNKNITLKIKIIETN